MKHLLVRRLDISQISSSHVGTTPKYSYMAVYHRYTILLISLLPGVTVSPSSAFSYNFRRDLSIDYSPTNLLLFVRVIFFKFLRPAFRYP